jgi:hypothetical protein
MVPPSGHDNPAVPDSCLQILFMKSLEVAAVMSDDTPPKFRSTLKLRRVILGKHSCLQGGHHIETSCAQKHCHERRHILIEIDVGEKPHAATFCRTNG